MSLQGCSMGALDDIWLYVRWVGGFCPMFGFDVLLSLSTWSLQDLVIIWSEDRIWRYQKDHSLSISCSWLGLSDVYLARGRMRNGWSSDLLSLSPVSCSPPDYQDADCDIFIFSWWSFYDFTTTTLRLIIRMLVGWHFHTNPIKPLPCTGCFFTLGLPLKVQSTKKLI